jgi:hypothetical protein
MLTGNLESRRDSFWISSGYRSNQWFKHTICPVFETKLASHSLIAFFKALKWNFALVPAQSAWIQCSSFTWSSKLDD